LGGKVKKKTTSIEGLTMREGEREHKKGKSKKKNPHGVAKLGLSLGKTGIPKILKSMGEGESGNKNKGKRPARGDVVHADEEKEKKKKKGLETREECKVSTTNDREIGKFC